MMEALEIKDIDTMIKALEKELKGVKTPDIVISSAPAAVESNEVITISEEDIVVPTLLKKKSLSTEEKESEEPSLEQAVPPATANNIDEEKPEERPDIPTEEALQDDIFLQQQKTFDTLVKRIYDRDFDLGSCFERNIHFQSFENGALTWESEADGEEKKMLITHWAVIKMFVQDLFGIETKIVNIPRPASMGNPAAKKKLDAKGLEGVPPSCDTDSGSMIEAVEMKSSCIMPESGETEAAKEKEPSNILEEPMVKEILDLFDPKKVRVRRKA
jgi:DNA polymerase-3 subunit gamma/tau